MLSTDDSGALRISKVACSDLGTAVLTSEGDLFYWGLWAKGLNALKASTSNGHLSLGDQVYKNAEPLGAMVVTYAAFNDGKATLATVVEAKEEHGRIQITVLPLPESPQPHEGGCSGTSPIQHQAPADDFFFVSPPKAIGRVVRLFGDFVAVLPDAVPDNDGPGALEALELYPVKDLRAVGSPPSLSPDYPIKSYVESCLSSTSSTQCFKDCHET